MMKTANIICPTCGAVLDIKQNIATTRCKYCGNTVLVVFDGGEKNTLTEQKTLFSTLVERKYIYYIPRFNGINDCYEFLLDYGEAAFLYEKNKEELTDDEKKLITAFFQEGREYISQSVKENADKMILSQLDKYKYAFNVLNESNLECGTFEELHNIISNKIINLPKLMQNEITPKKAMNKSRIIVLIIILSVVLLPGIISFIIGLYF